MDWRLGTIGFGYDDWAGVFYPPRTKSGEYLAFYSQYFNAVELDTTFHATPPPERFQRWADATPADFRFCVKTPRLVTHDVALDRAAGAMRQFIDVARSLGDKLGVVLIQFPPHVEANQTGALSSFLGALPTDVRYAVELRNRTWGNRHTLDLLHHHRCAFVSASYTTRPSRVFVTTDFAYVRWIGEHERFKELNHEQLDMTDDLHWWSGQLTGLAGRVKTTWGFFGNDYAGYAIASANRFKAMTGQPVWEPPAIPGGLFG